MRTLPLVLGVFVVVSLAQVSVPGLMIAGRERVLREGVACRLDTEPVDPYDAFRGRYVALRFADREVTVAEAEGYRRGQRLYVELAQEAGDVVRPVAVSLEKPEEGLFLKARVAYLTRNPARVVIDYPFDRYYMNEFEAPEAEAVYRRANRDEELEAQALVRVHRGRAVLETVLVNGMPIEDYLRQKGGAR